MLGADEQVFRWLNGLAGQSPALDAVVRLLASDFFLPIAMTLAAFALWFAGRTTQERTRHQRGFLYAVIGAGFANLMVRIINGHVDRARPFLVLDDVQVLLYQPTDPSFPSNAAALGFALAAGVWLVNRRWGLLIGVGGLLFSGARVVAGMHYPLDIAGGALVGILIAWVFARALDMIDPLLQRALALLRWFFLA